MLRLVNNTTFWTHKWGSFMNVEPFVPKPSPEPNPLMEPEIQKEWFRLPQRLHDAQEQISQGNYEKFAEDLLDIGGFCSWLAKEIIDGLPSQSQEVRNIA